MEYLPLREACKRLGVSSSTLRRWERQGKIKCIRTPTGHRRFSLEEFIHSEQKKAVICYARVSSHQQRENLARQIELLRSKYPTAEIIAEVGSGLNFRRKRFLTVLDRIYQGDVGTLVVAYPDRLLRFGFPLIEWFCQKTGCQLVVLNQITLSPQEELVQDILSILHSFSSRLYGLRKYKKEIREVLQKANETQKQEVKAQQCIQD